MKKTTKAEFRRFEKEARRLQLLFGLTDWHFYFTHGRPDDVKDADFFACVACEDGAVATFWLNDELDDRDYAQSNPERHALHEVLHVMTWPLKGLAERRYIQPGSPEEEWERLVRRLEKVVKV